MSDEINRGKAKIINLRISYLITFTLFTENEKC